MVVGFDIACCGGVLSGGGHLFMGSPEIGAAVCNFVPIQSLQGLRFILAVRCVFVEKVLSFELEGKTKKRFKKF